MKYAYLTGAWAFFGLFFLAMGVCFALRFANMDQTELRFAWEHPGLIAFLSVSCTAGALCLRFYDQENRK